MVTGQPEGLDIGEAAERLGITVTALHKRIKRGSVDADKVDDRWRVVLDSDQPTGHPGHPGADTGGHAYGQDGGQPSGQPDGQPDLYERLLQVKDAEVARLVEQRDTLVEQLAVKDEQLRQASVIIAQLTRRPRELAAPASAPVANESTPGVTTAGASTPHPHAGPRSAQVRRPWWAFWRS